MSELELFRSLPFHLTGRKAALCFLIGETIYVYYFVLLLKRPSARLLALLPLLPPAILVPWHAPTPAERLACSGIFLWVMGSKLLLMVWDRGPADDPDAMSNFPKFFSALVLSVHLKSENPAPATQSVSHAEEKSVIKSSRHGDSEPNGLTQRKNLSGGDQRLPAQTSISESDGKASAGSEVPPWRRWVAALVNSQKAPMALLRTIFFFVAYGRTVRLVVGGKEHVPGPLIYPGYFFCMYFTLSFFFEAAAGIPGAIFGFQLHPQFNMPFLATSLGEFWGQRWNLFVNNVIRVSVYEPILDWEKRRAGSEATRRDPRGSGAWKPSRWTRGLGTFACFLVSGVMHEVIFIYVTQAWPTFEVTAFFLVHGVGVIVEMSVMKSAFWRRSGLSLPMLLRWAYTMGFVWVTSAWLFFPPIKDNGMIDTMLMDFETCFRWVEQMISSAF